MPDSSNHTPDSMLPFIHLILYATLDYKRCILFSVNAAGSHPDSPSDGVCLLPLPTLHLAESLHPFWDLNPC